MFYFIDGKMRNARKKFSEFSRTYKKTYAPITFEEVDFS